jgi:alanine-glyoxylate transaminase / serine-glyoxylate transaminase / serine-pyruvate transaminase
MKGFTATRYTCLISAVELGLTCAVLVDSESHVGAPFVATFGETLAMLRKLFQTTDPSSQPFVISGSGTLGWDLVAANLAEPRDDVLVLHTGYFADSFADCFETYGVKATQLKAPIGSRPQLPEIEKALKEKKYKLLTVTHVDTSTGVLSELKALSEMVHRVSPDTLVIVDGVCSVGCEEIEFDKWQLDGVITASQKAIGCPAGLSISMYSGRAIKTFQARKTPPGSYFASFKNWLPSKSNQNSSWGEADFNSYAKLRSEESLVFCYSPTTTDPRSPYVFDSDPFKAIGRTLCGTQSNVAEN